jgi:hypothetical protein
MPILPNVIPAAAEIDGSPCIVAHTAAKADAKR